MQRPTFPNLLCRILNSEVAAQTIHIIKQMMQQVSVKMPEFVRSVCGSKEFRLLTLTHSLSVHSFAPPLFVLLLLLRSPYIYCFGVTGGKIK